MQPYPETNGGSASQRGYGPMPDEVRVWPRGNSGGVPLASWPWRMAAGAIDYLPALLILSVFASVHVAALGWLLFFGWLGFNSVYMQGTTSQSLGKRITGIRLAGAAVQGGGQYLVYPGVGLCFWRLLAHLLDLPFFPLSIGLLRPLWEREYRTFADSLTHTLVTSREWSGALERRAPDAIRAPGS
jgi:hypothetical protein